MAFASHPGEKADIFSNFFSGKQSSGEVPHTRFPAPIISFAFRSSELCSLLLDSYDGTDSQGLFPLFLKNIAKLLPPKLAVIFRILIRKGSFPICLGVADVTPVAKGSSPSNSPKECRPISVTLILSKVFES